MLTQNYTGLACLAVLKLQSGLCQLFGSKIKMKPRKITAGSVILIASLLNSIPESSEPRMGRSDGAVPEQGQERNGRVSVPESRAGSSRRAGSVLSPLGNPRGWKGREPTALSGDLGLTYRRVSAPRAQAGFSSAANASRFTSPHQSPVFVLRVESSTNEMGRGIEEAKVEHRRTSAASSGGM